MACEQARDVRRAQQIDRLAAARDVFGGRLLVEPVERIAGRIVVAEIDQVQEARALPWTLASLATVASSGNTCSRQDCDNTMSTGPEIGAASKPQRWMARRSFSAAVKAAKSIRGPYSAVEVSMESPQIALGDLSR